MRHLKEADITINGKLLSEVQSSTLRNSLVLALSVLQVTPLSSLAEGHTARLRELIVTIDETETVL
jgi:hypothetical protein